LIKFLNPTLAYVQSTMGDVGKFLPIPKLFNEIVFPRENL